MGDIDLYDFALSTKFRPIYRPIVNSCKNDMVECFVNLVVMKTCEAYVD